MVTSPNKIILLTGFEPFGAFALNPSELIAREMDGEMIAGQIVKSLILPVVFNQSADMLERTINELNPGAVVCLGLAGNRTEITPERIAVNLDDTDIPDNDGNQPVDSPIVPGGPVAYWSTLPVKEIVGVLRERKIPAALSSSAGNFVCNHLFYRLMHLLRKKKGILGGFIHLPPLPKQIDGKPGVAIEVLEAGIRVIVETVSTNLGRRS